MSSGPSGRSSAQWGVRRKNNGSNHFAALSARMPERIKWPSDLEMASDAFVWTCATETGGIIAERSLRAASRQRKRNKKRRTSSSHDEFTQLL